MDCCGDYEDNDCYNRITYALASADIFVRGGGKLKKACHKGKKDPRHVEKGPIGRKKGPLE